jgi:hypothetical protein
LNGSEKENPKYMEEKFSNIYVLYIFHILALRNI